MTPKPILIKTLLFFNGAMIFIVLTALLIGGCSPKKPPLSPEAQVFKKDIGKVLNQMQQSLTEPVIRGDISAIDSVLQGFSKATETICVDCPHRSGVLNKDGVLLTTFPKNEFIGRNFSSYRTVSEPLQKQKITQRQMFQADGSRIYYISAPLVKDNKVAGVVLLALTLKDIDEKWHLNEKEFLAIDFNTP
jgi:C4-dicarboxylate-specific signal transduction histidine kinase